MSQSEETQNNPPEYIRRSTTGGLELVRRQADGSEIVIPIELTVTVVKEGKREWLIMGYRPVISAKPQKHP